MSQPNFQLKPRLRQRYLNVHDTFLFRFGLNPYLNPSPEAYTFGNVW